MGVAVQESVRSIADRLGRAPSTISREIKNNSSNGRNRYRSRFRFGAPWRGGPQRRPQYKASAAQARSQRRARRPKPGKLAANPQLREEVQTRLDQQHSPEQITARLRAEFPDDPEMWVSPETIYQSIYVQGRGEFAARIAPAVYGPGERCVDRSAAPTGAANTCPARSASAIGPLTSRTVPCPGTGKGI